MTTFREKLAEWRNQMAEAVEYHDSAETVNPAQMLRLLDFIDKAVTAMKEPMAVHDDRAQKCNFIYCGCEYCKVIRPVLITLDQEIDR